MIKIGKDSSGEWKDYTLILPAVSVGNVGQLAVDLILSTFNAEQVEYVTHPSVLPLIGASPFDLNCPKIVTNWQVHECKDQKLVIMQQRAPVIRGHEHEYVSFLVEWIKVHKFKMVIMLSSCFSQYFSADALKGIPMHYLLTSTAKPVIFDSLKAMNWHEFNLGLVANKTHEHTLSDGGISNLFHAACEENDVPLLVMMYVCWEGDNYPEATCVTKCCLQFLSLSDDIQLKIPPSWSMPYGCPPSLPMY